MASGDAVAVAVAEQCRNREPSGHHRLPRAAGRRGSCVRRYPQKRPWDENVGRRREQRMLADVALHAPDTIFPHVEGPCCPGVGDG